MSAPMVIAVVGHTNAGKTSLLRTLTRRVDFGRVSDMPGTTRHVEAVGLRVAGRTAVRYLDTPGLEDAVALLAHVQQLPGGSRLERIRAFLQGPEAQGVFEQEAKVLRALLDADAAFLVIDSRETLLPKFRDELELIGACARPVLPVLNFLGTARQREPQWRAMLAEAGLHALVRFDAAAPFTGAERSLYQDLATLLPGRRAELADIAAGLQAEAAARAGAALRIVASGIVDTASLRRVVLAADVADPARSASEVEALRAAVLERLQRGVDELLALYGFREGDLTEAPLPELAGRWSLDLFNPEALRQAGLRLGRGAAIGAAVGLVADLAFAGVSLGAGLAAGSAIGGALSQGFGPLGRRLAARLRGEQELSADNAALLLSADWQLRLVRALETRGHGNAAPIAALQAAPDLARALTRAIGAAQAARAHPQWHGARRLSEREAAARAAVVEEVAAQLALTRAA